MPEITIEVGDDGSIAKMPEAVQKLIDKAFGQGQAKAADELAKKGKADPVEVERLKTLEVENSKLKEAEAIREKRYEDAQLEADKRHQAAIADERKAADALKAEIAKRDQRIYDAAKKDIRAAALEAGARKESLPELEVLIGGRIGLDDALLPFVRDEKDAGKPLLDKDGKAVSVEGFVQQYLADHPHHKAAPIGRGTGGGGGQSLRGVALTGAEAEKAALLEDVRSNPSVSNVARAFASIGKRSA